MDNKTDTNLDTNLDIKIKVSQSFEDLIKNIKENPNYNWDEGRPINDDYYKPLKEQLNTITVSEIDNIVKKQFE